MHSRLWLFAAMVTGVRRLLFCAALVVVWCLVSSDAAAQMRSVRSNRVNFRQAPAAEAAVLFTADQHYPVLVLERKRGWAKIRDFEGEIAWVAERLLTSQKTVAVIAKGVSARQQPNDEAPASFQAPWSEGFVVVRVASDWVLVQDADNRQGWIHRMFLWGSVPAYKPPAQP